MSLLRPIGPADHTFVLALNEEHVDLLSPMDDEALTRLRDWADIAAVIDTGAAEPAGFVMTFVPGTPYDSANYRWFGERYPDFYYLDRIVLAASARRGGLGGRVYDEVEARARETGASTFCLEVNVEPPNEPSLAFHRRRGFVEVDRHESHGNLVSLQVKSLA